MFNVSLKSSVWLSLISFKPKLTVRPVYRSWIFAYKGYTHILTISCWKALGRDNIVHGHLAEARSIIGKILQQLLRRGDIFGRINIFTGWWSLASSVRLSCGLCAIFDLFRRPRSRWSTCPATFVLSRHSASFSIGLLVTVLKQEVCVIYSTTVEVCLAKYFEVYIGGKRYTNCYRTYYYHPVCYLQYAKKAIFREER